MKVFVKRIYEPANHADGFRVLVDRVWPRGISKTVAQLNEWMPDLGPSTVLRRWFNHDPARWVEFCRRYHEELKTKDSLITALLKRAGSRPITLLYSAKDEQHNQAVALQQYLLQHPCCSPSAGPTKTASQRGSISKSKTNSFSSISKSNFKR